ncbi:MAG: bacillithiol biosynthesis cysteine-adding enzyme BshC [Candidatus Acidiferrales bacterium]
MDCHAIPFRLLPQQSKLFVRYVEDFSQVKRFYPHLPAFSSVQRAARKLRFPKERRETVLGVLREQNRGFGASAGVFANLDRFEHGAVAVVTGQQVGLFTGPAYTIYKALTAVKIADELTRSGVAAVPVFWMATEDHDLAEVNHCGWLAARALLRLKLDLSESGGQPVGNIQLGDGISALVESAAAALEGESADQVEAWLRESYGPLETYGSAFGKLMARVFGPHGLILLDPREERFHRVAGDIYRRALIEHESLTKELLARNGELEKAGYHSQVKVSPQSTLLFLLQEGKRAPLRVRNGRFIGGEESFGEKDLLELVAAAPERFSPNALLRSVVQDTLLPTVCSVVGPAEVAYYAQSSVLYEHLQVNMPVILPRASFTLVERPARRLLERYGLRVEDVWRGGQRVHREMEARALPASLAHTFDRGVVELGRLLGRLEKSVAKLDKTLIGAAQTAQRKMTYQLEKLRRKAGRANDFRTGVLAEHERQLFDALFPEHALQERNLCFLPFLARHGQALQDELLRRASGKGKARHHVVFLD